MVAIIGQDAKPLCRYLEGKGINAITFQVTQIPSLTALQLARTEITDIVILADAQKSWSLPHILSAAKQLQAKGCLVFLGHEGELPPLIAKAADRELLVTLLQRKPKPPAKASAGSGGLAAAKPVMQQPVIQPLRIPPDKILFLAVVGAQHRIGCTTQAIGLWHYCKALGFDPAVVASQEQIAEIAGTMHCKEIQSGYQIEGVPFVNETSLAYDCYILDVGTGSIPEALKAADYVLLVAGSKPWELRHTAMALRETKGEEILLLLSFSSQKDANSLQPLIGGRNSAVLPWMPELWKPSEEAMAMYETLLRPVLQRLMERDDRQRDGYADLQLSKGE